MSEDRYCCPCGIPTRGPGECCPDCEPPEKHVACLVCEAETWDTCICEPAKPKYQMNVTWIPNERRTGP